ncbi:hypothetical protein IDH44_15325 [Paenibacillus sp. IB182496]|uniref:Uncharacterized protein n=1 Tax=Paenibacillus sabuli TaxID=2772509 RepID=A0A927GT00_9BACL|nr:hypothetical protein [Paenibacillus sabuli]MBD2846570.1 hypothetical protein [Paenibacillus sabuli]
MAGKLNVLEIKKKLNDFSKEELVELVAESVRISKDTRAYVLFRLEGEAGLLEWVAEAKAQIDKEFNPTRGYPKLRPAIVKKTFTEINRLGKGTTWPLEIMIFFCETASAYIHDEGDIFENMGDFFTDTFEKIIRLLNKEKSPDRFNSFQTRLETIVKKPNCHCWGIQDSLIGSYTELKWVDEDEFVKSLNVSS